MAEVWWRGKRREAAGGARRARRHRGAAGSRVDGERRGTLWRVWKLVQAEVRVHMLGGAAGREEGGAVCVQGIMELTFRTPQLRIQRIFSDGILASKKP